MANTSRTVSVRVLLLYRIYLFLLRKQQPDRESSRLPPVLALKSHALEKAKGYQTSTNMQNFITHKLTEHPPSKNIRKNKQTNKQTNKTTRYHVCKEN